MCSKIIEIFTIDRARRNDYDYESSKQFYSTSYKIDANSTNINWTTLTNSKSRCILQLFFKIHFVALMFFKVCIVSMVNLLIRLSYVHIYWLNTAPIITSTFALITRHLMPNLLVWVIGRRSDFTKSIPRKAFV